MKILAVETSFKVASAAIMDNGIILGEYMLNSRMTHSQKLVPMIRELMDDLELRPKDIDVYAVSSGPGSFTGLRIGMATVKAMAYAMKKPVIGIPTLDALAFNIPLAESLVVPIMDARNNQVYTAVYLWENGDLARITGYSGIPISEVVYTVKKKNRKAIFVGDGVQIHREYLAGEMGDACEFAPGHLLFQKASSVAQAAYMRAVKGTFEDCFSLKPFYLRKSQAEREYEKKALQGS